jgi:hypothetical protein
VQGFVGIPQHRDYGKNLGVERSILFKWILVKYDGMKWSGLIWLRVRTVSGSCEYADEPFDSTKCGELLDQL